MIGYTNTKNIHNNTRPIIAKFNQVQESTELSADATRDTYTIEVDDTTGFVDGRYIILFHPISKNFSFYTQIGAPAGSVITLDTPLDFSYPAGTFVDSSITNLHVDGSSTTQVFGLRGTGAPPGVDITADVTRLIFECETASPVSLAKFGDLTKLTRGLVLRRRDGNYQNIFNVKTNGEIGGIMFDYEPFLATNPAQDVDGFVSRFTLSGPEKLNTAMCLPIGDDSQILVQDDLRTITKLEIVAEGAVSPT